MFLKIPSKIEYVINILEKNGFEAYIVGGCVRDLILGKTPYDYDITTNAMPEETKALFERTVDTGIKHGTVTVIIDGEPIEVTTYRIDGDYTDSRRPEDVKFVNNLKQDLARRDFTVNALCYNKNTGIIDLFGGIDDIKNKTLKTVGNPTQRFSEDALRIMRLFRFSSTLEFNIEKETEISALKLSNTLSNISAERIRGELVKTLMGKNLKKFECLVNSNAFEFLGINKNADLSDITNLPLNADLRLFAFIKKTSNNIEKSLSGLKLSNNTTRYIEKLLEIENMPLKNSRADIKNILSISSPEIFYDFIEFKCVTDNKDYGEIKKTTKEIIRNREPYLISHLDITGRDIENLGIRGEEIGICLKMLLTKVIESPELNKKEKLMKLIK